MTILRWRKPNKLKNKKLDRPILIKANGYYGVVSVRTVLINKQNTIECWSEIPKARKFN